MTPEAPLRLRLCATAFLWSPLVTFLGMLLCAAVSGRSPSLFSLLATPLLCACFGSLLHAIVVLRRSAYAARWVFIVLNGVAAVLAGFTALLLARDFPLPGAR